MKKRVRVAVSYRVLQSWRVPVFSMLSKAENIDLHVFYGEDFEGTKVVSFKEKVDFSSSELPSLTISFNTSNSRGHVPFSPSLYRQLKEFSPDVIISEGASNILNNIVCFLYVKLHKKKIIQWGLGEIKGRKISLHRRAANIFFNFIEKSSDAAISYSSFGAEYYKKRGLKSESVFTAVNVVDTTSRRAKYIDYIERHDLVYPPNLPAKFGVIFVGSLSENKNVDFLIEAFIKFSKNKEDVELVIIGEGHDRGRLEGLAAGNAEISFIGDVREDIGRYFYDSSVMVLPGLGGLAISDAMVHGVSVICSVGDGCEQDLLSSGAGVVLDEMTLDLLVDELNHFYGAADELAEMRRECLRVINNKYNIEEYVGNIIEAIDYCSARD